MEPDRFSGHPSQNRNPCIHFNRNSLIVILTDHAQAPARANAGSMQEEQQLGVPLLEARYCVALPCRSLRERNFAAPLALRGAFRQHRIAMRTGTPFSQFLAQLFLEGW